jgi:hypothetical protein
MEQLKKCGKIQKKILESLGLLGLGTIIYISVPYLLLIVVDMINTFSHNTANYNDINIIRLLHSLAFLINFPILVFIFQINGKQLLRISSFFNITKKKYFIYTIKFNLLLLISMIILEIIPLILIGVFNYKLLKLIGVSFFSLFKFAIFGFLIVSIYFIFLNYIFLLKNKFQDMKRNIVILTLTTIDTILITYAVAKTNITNLFVTIANMDTVYIFPFFVVLILFLYGNWIEIKKSDVFI